MKTSRFTFKPPAGPQRDTQEKVWSALDKATKNRQPMCVHILIYTKQTKNTKHGRFSTINFHLFFLRRIAKERRNHRPPAEGQSPLILVFLDLGRWM